MFTNLKFIVCGLAVLAFATESATAATGVYKPTGPTTVQHMHGFPCSSTAFGPEFPNGSYKPTGGLLSYGGGTSCQGGVGIKKIVVHAEVLGQNGHTWVEISGSRIVAGPSSRNPVRTFAKRTAYLGRVYRVVSTAVLTVPFPEGFINTIYITAISKGYAPR